MRLPLTAYGWPEILLFCAVFGAAAGLGLFVVGGAFGTALGIAALASLAFCLSFFRDPERTASAPPEVVIAPADGRVADIEKIEEPPHMDGPALRVGIFLSVFDVHVNRSPLAGRVLRTERHPGRFLDARDPECITENEAVDLVLDCGQKEGSFTAVVRQITGLIARRIVCRAKDGESLARGQRYGMIKFGSRTEVYVPEVRVHEILVKVGDRVRGGADPILRLNARP